MYLYSIFDVVLEEFAPPFVAKNDKAASRMFLQGIRKMPSPNDLSLWRVGTFFAGEKSEPCIVGCVPEAVPVEVGGSDD